MVDTNEAGCHPLTLSTGKKRMRDPSEEADDTTPSAKNRTRREKLRVQIPVSTSSTLSSPASTTRESPSSLFSAYSTPSAGLVDCPTSTASYFTTVTTSPQFPPIIELPHEEHRTHWQQQQQPAQVAALLTAPPIKGLFFDPALTLPQELADEVMEYCLRTYFINSGINQVMLFGRFREPPPPVSESKSPSTSTSDSDQLTDSAPGLPIVLVNLLSTLSHLLKPLLSEKTYALLFPAVPIQARQAIINLYAPGEGISPHIDLLKRYGDGIIGVSFGSGCVMCFEKESTEAAIRMPDLIPSHDVSNNDRWDLYLPERSVIVLTEEARYEWTHGIEKLTRDYVAIPRLGGPDVDVINTTVEQDGRWIDRDVRLSVTFRWLLPGADVVGPT